MSGVGVEDDMPTVQVRVFYWVSAFLTEGDRLL